MLIVTLAACFGKSNNNSIFRKYFFSKINHLHFNLFFPTLQ